MDSMPQLLLDFAARIHELVAKPTNMQRFRDVLGHWAADQADPSQNHPDILPLSRPLSLEEQYVLLASVHDTCCEGLPRIWADSEGEWSLDDDRTRRFWSVAYHLPEAIEGKLSVLKAFLADVEVDLATGSEDPAGPGEQAMKTPPQGATSAKINAGMTWQDARKRAEKHVKDHDGAFPRVMQLAKIIGCSRRTIDKAVKNSAYLKARKAEAQSKQSGRTVPLSDNAIEEASQRQHDELADLIAEQKSDMMQEIRQAQTAKKRRS